MSKQEKCTWCGEEGRHSSDCPRKPREGNGFLKVTTPLFSASVGGRDMQIRDLIGVATLAGMIGGGALWWYHTVEAKETGAEVVRAIKVVSIQQREAACILRFEVSKREEVYAFCRQLSREPLP